MKTGLSWELLGHPCCLSLRLCRLGPRLLTDGPGLRFLRVILVSRWFSPHVQCLRFKGKTPDFIRFYISVTMGYYGHQLKLQGWHTCTWSPILEPSQKDAEEFFQDVTDGVFPIISRFSFHFGGCYSDSARQHDNCRVLPGNFTLGADILPPESTSPLENALDSTSEAIWHGYTIPSCSSSKHFAGSIVQSFNHILHLGIACRLRFREVQEYYPDDLKLVLSARCGCDHGWGRQKIWMV